MKPITKTVVIVLIALAAGFVLRGLMPSRTQHDETSQNAESSAEQLYICPMMCVPPSSEPGNCPVCGMALIPDNADGSAATTSDRPSLTLTPDARALLKVETAPVERRAVQAEVRMTGKIDFDETRLAYIAARVAGRIDRLYADFTGIQVNEGEHLVHLYSPELLSAQEELIQSLKTSDQINTEAAREKLRLWGMTTEQIEAVEKNGAASDHMTIYAPIGGIVTEKHAIEGMYVKTGTPIYTIADLDHLWVMLDVYESDLSMVAYGQKVEVETEAYPGRIFEGAIAFIDPVLNENTRSVKVRVNVPNPAGLLKPGMFVHAAVHPAVLPGGTAAGPDLDGKWICPMHPEIVDGEAGQCSICSMNLIKAEDSRFASTATADGSLPLVIPASAPLITGKRAIVYVEQSGGTYEGREITLGIRAGKYYLVEAGLAEHERVVVNGAFMIDSALQIMASPSMMNPGSKPDTKPAGSCCPGPAPTAEAPTVFDAMTIQAADPIAVIRIEAAETPDEEPVKAPAPTIEKPVEPPKAGRAQSLCPVMGGAILPNSYVDVKGYRIYLCCGGCSRPILADPDKYIRQMKSDGIEIERTPVE